MVLHLQLSDVPLEGRIVSSYIIRQYAPYHTMMVTAGRTYSEALLR